MNVSQSVPDRAGKAVVRRREMSDQDRKDATTLLDAARDCDNPDKAMKMRIVAALLHGQEHASITRNLGASEKTILACKEAYDAKGVYAFVARPRRPQQ